MKIKKENVKHERRKLVHQTGIFLSSNEIINSFTCWTANASKGNNYYTIKRMEKFAMQVIQNQREVEKKLEASQATIEKLNATIEYLAMMAGVDISQPEEIKEVPNV